MRAEAASVIPSPIMYVIIVAAAVKTATICSALMSLTPNAAHIAGVLVMPHEMTTALLTLSFPKSRRYIIPTATTGTTVIIAP